MKVLLTLLTITAFSVGAIVGYSTHKTLNEKVSEIQKYEIWDFDTHQPRTVWIIEGEKYLVKTTPNKSEEIVGKLSRFVPNHKRIR